MSEEAVTKAILKWLLNNQWQIVCFDFPQSGTGRLLHPNGAKEKNKGSINPDIVAVKNGLCLFFENKNYYYYPDFEKQHRLITANNYTEAISSLLSGFNAVSIKYGIGFMSSNYSGGAITNRELVDFIVGVDETKAVRFLYNPSHIAIS